MSSSIWSRSSTLSALDRPWLVSVPASCESAPVAVSEGVSGGVRYDELSRDSGWDETDRCIPVDGPGSGTEDRPVDPGGEGYMYLVDEGGWSSREDEEEDGEADMVGS